MTARGTKYWNSGAIPLIAPEILGDIISEVSDLGLVIDDDGVILSVLVNPNYDSFGAMENLEGTQIRASLTVESIPKFDRQLDAFLEGQKNLRPLELNHHDDKHRWEFPLRYTFHHVGPDGAILLLGRDLRPIAEMQQQLVNAQLALERDYEDQREFEIRFRVLMETATDAMVFVSLQTGKITHLNDRAAALLDQSTQSLTGKPIEALFDTAKSPELLNDLANQALNEPAAPYAAQTVATKTDVALHPTLFRASGDRIMLCRIAPVQDAKTPQDHLVEYLRNLFQKGSDGIVFTDANGQVVSANEGFLDLIGTAHDVNVRGRGIAEFMQRGSVDFKVMTESANRTGRIRMYATKIAGDYGSPRPVEIAVTSLTAGADPIFAFVLREATRTEATRPANDNSDQMQSVVELVGSASLRDIVSETTNVVERMCIETAVELTKNNRVAAAEMLGLSRQSLYVKLRKFGLMERGTED